MFNFPTSPTVGQNYQYGNNVWSWDGNGWQLAQKHILSYLTQVNELGFHPFGTDGGYIDGSVVIHKDLEIQGTRLTFANDLFISIQGTTGTGGQVLTTNGTAMYWGAGLNTASQYTWSNLNTYTANVTFQSNVTFQYGSIEFNTTTNTFNFGTESNYPVAFISNSVEKIRIDTSGNVIFQSTDLVANNSRIVETIANNFSNVSGTVALDLSIGDYFAYTLVGNTTFAFSNPPTSGTVQTFMLICKQDAVGSRTITWPLNVHWSNASEPVETTNPNKSDIFSFVTTNGGTTYAGSWSMANTAAF